MPQNKCTEPRCRSMLRNGHETFYPGKAIEEIVSFPNSHEPPIEKAPLKFSLNRHTEKEKEKQIYKAEVKNGSRPKMALLSFAHAAPLRRLHLQQREGTTESAAQVVPLHQHSPRSPQENPPIRTPYLCPREAQEKINHARSIGARGSRGPPGLEEAACAPKATE